MSEVEARMTAEARNAVLNGCRWFTEAQIVQIREGGGTNPSDQPKKWKEEGRIFTLSLQGVDHFPAYALDPSTGYGPARGLSAVLAAFRGRKDDWGLAYWFASVNSFIGGKRPQDLLISEPARVVAAAQDEAAGVLHG